MRVAASAIAIIYGLSAIAGSLAGIMKKRIEVWSGVIMAVSGVSLITGAIMFLTGHHYDFRFMVVGLVGIALTAIRNGYYIHGKPTPSHHLVRLLIAAAIVSMVLRVGT